MNKAFYLKSCFRLSRLLTNRYSTSFSAGIFVLPRPYRDAIYGLYGFVRLADETVDTFHDFDQKELLVRFKKETYAALQEKVSMNPILHAFQSVVNAHAVDVAYLEAFFDSMEMDLTRKTYDRASYERYIYGSAEAVGLMCLSIFCGGDKELFASLAEPAKKLGSAFQKVNFLRDMKSDLELRGRIYFPDVVRPEQLTDAVKEKSEREIDEEFRAALEGIKRLPGDVRLAVYSAYVYYMALFQKLRRQNMGTLLSRRVRIPDFIKVFLFLRACLIAKFCLGR